MATFVVIKTSVRKGHRPQLGDTRTIKYKDGRVVKQTHCGPGSGWEND